MKRCLWVGFLLLIVGVYGAGAEPVVGPQGRVAVVGDSITEQKLYSRYIELYLLACMPQLETVSMQYGWGGERAIGFQNRMNNDLAGFSPTVVTTCYGMNDGGYRAFEAAIGKAYEDPMREIIRRLKEAGVTVVVGGPGVVDSKTFRNDPQQAAVYNENLRQLSEIARALAAEAGMPFADVHGAMWEAMGKAKAALGEGYPVAGGDGVHPAANGHLVMAYAFLKAMGFDGDLGTITLDMRGASEATGGHRVVRGANGEAEVESRRWPFCFFGGEADPNGTRSILPYVPFNAELNRLTLVVRNLEAAQGKVTWGEQSKVFTKAQLEAGINLAAEFLDNPFSAAFQKLDGAVAQKQSFETFMIKSAITTYPNLVNQMGQDVEVVAAVATLTNKLWARQARYAEDVRAQVGPITHELRVEAVG